MSALSHILASDPEPHTVSSSSTTTKAAEQQPRGPSMSSSTKRKDNGDDHTTATPKARTGDNGHEGSTTKRNAGPHTAAATTNQVSHNSKLKHLKKEDGIPLWRKDIQYDFLNGVLHDKTRCFTNYSEGTKNHTFAEVYVDAMAKSSKCSRILKEKLLQDQEGAITMAMVCLLVNIGRMNTTLNFFPEMRAQLRTYHSIPALQAQQDPTAYKQLQDAPRLKSILKGATEDNPQPSTIEDVRKAPHPRTNAVNLIFLMTQYNPKITELHFPPDQDYFDLIMRTSLGSETRAKAFLWLMWWYLESDFSYEDSQRNPFGPGEFEEGGKTTNPLQVKVPALKVLSEEEEAAENVDTEEEKKFGEDKRKERISILASEPSPAMTALKRARKEKGITVGHHAGEEDGSEAGWGEYSALKPHLRTSGWNMETASEMTRSPSPGGSRFHGKHGGDMRINNLLNSDDYGRDRGSPSGPPVKKGPGRGNWRRKPKGEAGAPGKGEASHQKPLLPNTGQLNFVTDGPNDSFASWGDSPRLIKNGIYGISKHDHVPTPSYQAQKRTRGMTQHQSAVVNHRKQQIDYSLDRRIRKAHERARERREHDSAVIRAWRRIRAMPLDYDSEEEAIRIRRARERSEKDTEDWRSTAHRYPHSKDGNDDYFDNVEMWRRPRMLYAGFVRTSTEPSDVGEESRSLAQSFRRASRRLGRWQENSLPGEVVLRRMAIEAAGGFEKPPPRKLSPDIDMADLDELQAPASVPARRGRGGRRGGGGGRGGRRRAAEVEARQLEESKMDLDPEPEPEPDDEDGTAELDEEDREILGEVDADESEDDDEDENMDD